MRLAEIARHGWVVGAAAAALVGTLALRSPAPVASPAPPVVDVPERHELTMQIQEDCASDVVTDGAQVRVTLRIPGAAQCTTQLRVYHLENDRLVLERD